MMKQATWALLGWLAFVRVAAGFDVPPMQDYTRDLFEAMLRGDTDRANELIASDPARARRFAYDRLEQRDARGIDVGIRVAKQLGDSHAESALTYLRSLAPGPRRGLLVLPETDDALVDTISRTAASGIPYLEARSRREFASRKQAAGQLDEAHREISRVIELDRAIDERFGLAFDLFLAGRIAWGLGEPSAAFDTLEESLRVADGIHQTDLARELVRTLGDLGSILGRYADALGYRQRAVDTARDPTEEGHARSVLGGMYSEVGLPVEAEFEIKRAIDCLSVAAAPVERGAVFVALGLARLDAGRPTQALAALDEGRSLLLPTDNRAALADAELHRGSALLELGRHEDAVQAYRASAALQDARRNPFGFALARSGLGDSLLRLGRFDEARTAYGEALATAAELPGPDVSWRATAGLGRLAERADRTDEALDYYHRAIDDLESLRRLLLAPSIRSRYLSNKLDLYRSASRLLARRGRDEESFAMAERVKARTLLELSTRTSPADRSVPLGFTTKLPPALRDELLAIEQTLAMLEFSGASPRSPDRAARLETTRARHQKLRLAVEIEATREASLAGVADAPSLTRIQATLGPREALLEYVSTEKMTCVWVVRRDHARFVELPVDRATLASRISSILRPIADLRAGRVDIFHLHFDTRSSRQLERELITPLEHDLEGCDVLWIVPDGPLRQLPFSLLLTAHQKRPVDPTDVYAQYAGCEFLIERFAIGYLPIAGLLLTEPRAPRQAGPVVVLGAPLPQPSGARALRHTNSEAREIAGLFEQPTLLIGAESSVDRVLGGTPPDILHIATHGELDDRRPAYSRLALAGRWVHAYEVVAADFKGSHVVLSACETVGEPGLGEGFLGLTRAFLEAGARSVIATAWSVDDGSTAQLMCDYHTARLELGSGVEALRRSQMAMIRSGRRPGVRLVHPFFWAGFLHIGPGC